MMIKEFANLREMKAYCEERAIEIPRNAFAAAFISAGTIKKSIQETFGDKSVLAPLADSTVEIRTDSDPTRPLLVDGSLLKDSIESRAEPLGDGAVGGVGSSEALLLQHERGYVTASGSMIPNKVVPPRPVFTVGVYRALPAVREIAYELLTAGVKLFTRGGRFASFGKPEALMTNPGKITDAVGEI